MSDVDTLFIISSSRGSYVLEDMLSAIAWASAGRSHFTVVVDETATLAKLDAPGHYELIHSTLPGKSEGGFHRACGLKWAIESGNTYRQVIMLSDRCLLTSQAVDSFFLDHMQNENIGVIGVRAERSTARSWKAALPLLFQWKVQLDGWERPPISLCDDFLVLSNGFISQLQQRELLVPDNCADWPATYGDYVSWLGHIIGLYVVSWGFETKPLPPLYISHTTGTNLPAPHLFSQRMVAFAPIDGVMGYSEGDLRELFKQHRGERSRDIQKLQPVVTGPEQRDTTLG